MGEIAPSATDARSGARSKAGYARYVFTIMFVISFLNYLDRFVMVGAANTIAQELGFNLDGIGYISSAFLVVYTLAALPLGIWADRVKRRDVIALCVAVWSVITALTALASNFATLFIARMLLGVGEAGYFPAGTALMSDYFSREKRSRVMSWWSIAQLFGILGGYAIGGAIAGLYTGSWRLAFLITGIPGLIFAYLIWRVREPGRNEADEEESALRMQEEATPLTADPRVEEPVQSTHGLALPKNLWLQLWSMLRIKSFAVLVILQIFAFFVTGVNTVFLPIYLHQNDTFGLTTAAAGLYSGIVIVVAGLAGTVAGGYMADYLNRRHRGARILVCGIGFLLGAPAFAAVIVLRDLTLFTIFFVLTTFLLTVYTGPSTAATADVVPSNWRASAVAITLLVAHLLGDAFAPAVIGVVATWFDPTGGQHFQANMAGQDLSIALLITCVPALIIAGLVGIFGARWMAGDVAAAEQADRELKAAGT